MKITNNFSVGGSLIYDYNNYDKVGNRLSMKVNDANAHVYEYDNLYQLTIADYNNGSQNRYDYDPLGNRTMLSNGTQTTYESNKLNQYERVGVVNYSYDINGNLTNDGQYTYIYDCESRLIEVKQGEATIVTYAYDFKGRRVRKSVGASVTQFSYDGDKIISDYNDAGVLLAKYVYGPGIDKPIYLVSGGNGYYYFFDGLGSVVALARNGSAPTEVYSYDVFGEPNRVSNIGNRYMFTGREFEPETGLYYYRARYYYPQLGRFLQTDPIGYGDGMNIYAYVSNNPIIRTDPLGMMGKPAPRPPKPKKPPKDCMIACQEIHRDMQVGCAVVCAKLGEAGIYACLQNAKTGSEACYWGCAKSDDMYDPRPPEMFDAIRSSTYDRCKCK